MGSSTSRARSARSGIPSALYAAREIVQLIGSAGKLEPALLRNGYLGTAPSKIGCVSGPWPEEALRIFATLARTLVQAHSRGILHTDLKPANVCCSMGSSARAWPTSDGHGCQTSYSVARDLLLHGAGAGAARCGARMPAGMLYGLGAILFALLTGEPPYKTPDSHAVIWRLTAPRIGCSPIGTCCDWRRRQRGAAENSGRADVRKS